MTEDPNSNGKKEKYKQVSEYFAETLKKIRNEQGLTQHHLEDGSGLSLRMISNMERAISQPSLTTILQLADGLGISVIALMKEFLEELDRRRTAQEG